MKPLTGRLKATFEDLGGLALKNIERPVQAFSVKWEPSDWQLPVTSEVTVAPATAPQVPLPLPDKPSIAVLPFQNMSGDPEQEYFADGMVEDIITGAVALQVAVRDRPQFELHLQGQGARHPAGRPRTRRALRAGGQCAQGGATACASPASSSMRRPARISGRTASTASLEDIFELQDRVTASVVGAIAPKLEQAEIERAMRKPTESLDAYDCFLRGLAHYHLFTRDSLLEARRLFRRATDLDPDYAAAYGFGAWCVSRARRMAGWLTRSAKSRRA